MIEYDFYNLLNDGQIVFAPNYICSIINNSCSLTTDSIDQAWTTLMSEIKTTPKMNIDYIDELKYDVLLSIYTSVHFKSITSSTEKDILNTLTQCQGDATNERRSLTRLKNDLREKLGPFKIYSQQYDLRSLYYFKGFWENTPSEIGPIFNPSDFYYYIKALPYSPLYPDNRYGLSLYNCINCFKDMGCNFLHSSCDPYAESDKEFSAYIFEELFSFSSFIRNILKFIDVFQDIIPDYKSKAREQAIILSQPIFKLPNKLWNHFADDYYKCIYDFIQKPNSYYRLKGRMEQIIFFQKFLFRYLQIFMGSALYHCASGDLTLLDSILQEYIFDDDRKTERYFLRDLQEQEKNINAATYPLNCSQRDSSIKLTDAKRNNDKIETFEINFTNAFWGTKYIPDYFDQCRGGYYLTVDQYTSSKFADYFNLYCQARPGYETYNYLKVKAEKEHIPY